MQTAIPLRRSLAPFGLGVLIAFGIALLRRAWAGMVPARACAPVGPGDAHVHTRAGGCDPEHLPDCQPDVHLEGSRSAAADPADAVCGDRIAGAGLRAGAGAGPTGDGAAPWRARAGGDLAARVDEGGGDELAALAAEFNRMAAQLAAADDQRGRLESTRRDLIAAISHDLRTPLASLRVMTEALADGLVEDPATTARYLATMRGQIGHLSSLIDDLFELA